MWRGELHGDFDSLGYGNEDIMEDILSKTFTNPDVKYRVKPFWFWNGDMKEEEILLQLTEMKKQGLGGAFVCARQGMSVPYLSDRWFQLIRYTVEEAKRLGLEIWLYDEYPYPSGMAGGEVLLRHPEAKHQILKYQEKYCQPNEKLELKLPWAQIISATAIPQYEENVWSYEDRIDIRTSIGVIQQEELYQISGLTAYNRKRFFSYDPVHVMNWNAPQQHNGNTVKNWKVEICVSEEMQDFKYFGGFFDPCCKDAVDTFIEVTHERYKQYLGDEFGKTIKGFFSDEVGLLSRIPWSSRVLKAYQDRFGVDLKNLLPALFDKDFPDCDRIRYQYFDCIHKLFRGSYHENVAKWCEKNHLMYVTEVPSMRMSTQRYSHVIGGDCCHEKLGLPLETIYDKYLHHYRSNSISIASLARQLKKEYAMVEAFHSLGWTMTIQDAKAMIDYMGVHGINLFNFHAFYYTIDGITKHDAPPSQFLQNPYWKYYHFLADYAARVSAFNKLTQSVTDVAVLNPDESLWICEGNPFHGYGYGGNDQNEKELCEAIRNAWSTICKTILFHQCAYEHLDGDLMTEGTVSDGTLTLGDARYHVLVIPPVVAITKATAEKILEFLQSGGTVIAVGKLEHRQIEGLNIENCFTEIEKEDGFIRIEGEFALTESMEERLISEIRKHSSTQLQVSVVTGDRKEIMVSCRENENGNQMLYINNHYNQTAVVEIRTVSQEPITELIKWSLEDGTQKKSVFQDDRKDSDRLQIKLQPYESMILEVPVHKSVKIAECKIKSRESTICKDQCADERDLQNAQAAGNEQVQMTDASKWDLQDGIYSRTQPKLIIDTGREHAYSLEKSNVFRMDEFELSLNQKEWITVEAKPFIEQMAEHNIIPSEAMEFYSEFGTPRKMKIHYPLLLHFKTTFSVTELAEHYELMHDKKGIRGEYQIILNGNILDAANEQHARITDFCNRVSDITDFIRQGENTLEIQVKALDDECGITDPIYILGDFSVDAAAISIGQEVLCTDLNRPVLKNSPYYSGTINWKTSVEIADSDFTSHKGDCILAALKGYYNYGCVELMVNGKYQDTRCFAPYEFCVQTKDLIKGNNEIELRVTNTLSSMLEGTWFDYDNHITKTVTQR